MKKIRIISCSIFFMFFSGIIIYFSIPKNFSTINIAGSSSVSPLVSLFANSYSSSDIVVQAGGSGLGIKVAVEGKKDIGMASKNPYINFDIKNNPNSINELPQNWIDKEMKTTTICWDGMGVVYKPPLNDKEFQLDINLKTISEIYLAFSGIEDVKFNRIGSLSDLSITPFARDGGGKLSGTAEAFFKTSNLNWEANILDKNKIKLIKSALNEGDYGERTIKTAEANSQAWNFFKSENIYGSMIYLSAGFIINNINEIKDSGYKIATYNNIAIDSKSITTGYNWYRPLNLMFSLSEDKKYIKDFIEWILIDVSSSEIIKTSGYIELSEIQKNTMKNNNGSYWISDKELGFSGAKSG